MNDFNIDENTINKIKDMMNNGDLSEVISKIPPDILENFSNLNKKSSNVNKNINSNSNPNNTKFNSNNNSNSSTNFDFNNIDMNTILKMKSIMENLNNPNDPRTNLLNSLKPYLRDERKEKIDQYANLLNVAKIAELLKNADKKNGE